MEHNRLDFEKKYGRLLTDKEGQLENYRNLIDPNRTDLLNCLVEKYELKRYLEIGVQDPKQNFDRIRCKDKISVDPDPKANAIVKMTSDGFFHWLNTGGSIEFSDDPIPETVGGEFRDAPDTKFDLIFIDGLHTAEQVKKDFENALKILSPNGFIVLHDCNPEKEEHTIVPRPTPTGHWNGSCYKFAVRLNCEKRTVDIDNGCMVVPHPFIGDILHNHLIPDDWNFFDKNRKELLNLISWDEFITL